MYTCMLIVLVFCADILDLPYMYIYIYTYITVITDTIPYALTYSYSHNCTVACSYILRIILCL